MKAGFSESEYERVREWLVAAMQPNPAIISEETLLKKLRFGEWLLVTSENAASVIELCEIGNERIANVLLIGGRKNHALREIMRAHLQLSQALKAQGYTKLVGTPRKEWRAFLTRNGFEQEQEELIKRL